MAILAGQIVTADQLNHLQPAVYYAQAGSGTSITTTSFTPIVGCSITLDTDTAARFSVQANFSWDINVWVTTIPWPYTRGALFLDGVQQSGESRWSEGTTGGDTGDYSMAGKAWGGTLSAAGTHTFDLRGAWNDLSGESPDLISTGFTAITVTIYEIV